MPFACSEGQEGSADAARVCIPRDCTAEGVECGEIEDGFGGCADCGRCTAPNFCGGAGVRHKCGCAAVTCASQEANCGTIHDACTNTDLECGTCDAPDSCGGSGMDNVCGHMAGEGEACNTTSARCALRSACCNTRDGMLCLATPSCPGALPDLIVDPTVVQPTLRLETKTFADTDCAVMDQCIVAGTRTVLRFTTQTPNVGFADVDIGDPEDPPMNPDFVFSMCHVHYHYTGYMKQRLLAQDGTEVAHGFKAAFCLEDAVRALPDADVAPAKKYECGMTRHQGIQPGWADYYGAGLDCQWIDVTGVPPGNYELELEVNPDGRIRELRRDNNRVRVPVTIP